MVKADPKCDYYADLEVLPSADAVEIKKQFKKLALKYHPDRNPGKELEFNSKFQAIQSAHEVLTDPQQRAKYDSDRIRSAMLHTYPPNVRPQPPSRAAASNFPPPPRRTPQASSTTNYPSPPSSASNRYASQTRHDPANAPKSYAEEAKARANAFKAWEQMRHGQPAPPQTRPVPPRPTNTAPFKPSREAGSYPPKDSTHRPTWDQAKEPHPGLPKMARSNTTRVPKKGGFAPGFSAGDEPPARNTSAYANMANDERPDVTKPSFESRPPPPSAFNQRTTTKRPDPLNAYRSQSGADDPFASNERISTPYATSGGEKTYFTSSGLGRAATARDGPTSGDIYDSEPVDGSNPHTRSASATPQRGHHSASPNLRSPRPVSISSMSSSSSDESLREGVEQLYTSAEQSHAASGRNQNGHLRPTYKPFVRMDQGVEGKGSSSRGRDNAADESKHTSRQNPQSTGSEIDPSSTEGFMEHRMKHEAERTQGMRVPMHLPPQRKDFGQSQQRPLHRPKSWHEKYGPADQDSPKDKIGRSATGEFSSKPSMYDDSGFDPSFLSPFHKWYDQWPFGGSRLSSTSRATRLSPPYWAIPSSVNPSRKAKLLQEEQNAVSKSPVMYELFRIENADKVMANSFTFPNGANGNRAHPPPLRSHSSDTISVNFSPSDWHGKFVGKPDEYFEPPPRQTNNARGRTSPTKRPISPLKQAHPASSAERTQVPKGKSHMPPPPAEPGHQGSDFSDKWAPYFKPGTLNWPLPPPPAGGPVHAASRKRLKTPSRRSSRNVFKRPAVPKPASVALAADDAGDEVTSDNLGSVSGTSSGNSSAMDLDNNMTPPSEARASDNRDNARSTTPRPPVPPRVAVSPVRPAPDGSHLNLGNLKNVAPFAPNQEGIKDLNDLSTALPFDSKASAKPPSSPQPQKLSLPNPPKAPLAPEKLTQSSWERYMVAMRTYMSEWNAYNTKMLNHFTERQASVETTLKPEWMSAVGEGTEQWGFAKYMRGVEEDFRVREHWDVSWERHRECMRTLGVVRETLLGSSVRGRATA
ncbi:MAG: hypothetical protein L6R35_005945 [Caloplaca aegaea]|nr:MAG: hypothetical protein L6R35_005945 [Caloplaca aegaea]